MITDDDTQVPEIEMYEVYDAFGNEGYANTIHDQPFKFTGEPKDENETELIYLRARYYDPVIGRFITRDTVAGQTQNPLTLNQYSYTLNNPVNLTDPSGNVVVAGCLGYSYGFLVYGSGSACYALDLSSLNHGLLFSASGGGTTGVVVGASLGLQFSEGSLADLDGSSVHLGGSAAFGPGFSFDAEIDTDEQENLLRSVTFERGLGLSVSNIGPIPIPAEFHGGVTGTISGPATWEWIRNNWSWLTPMHQKKAAK